ncbi:MAG: hypothetical protein K2X76_10445 [Sphingomonas sp.]|nr:hypothetical protein [Hyphomicrobiales bacterium]MBX9815109.1 hypothetical protein [Sphingomonas sp.]
MIELLLAIAAAGSQASQPVNLSTITGATLAQECARDRGLALDPCVSYVLGVADALQLERRTCRPYSDAGTLQTVAIVRRYISEHPENWGWHASALVREPLLKAFPCPRSIR